MAEEDGGVEAADNTINADSDRDTARAAKTEMAFTRRLWITVTVP